MNTLLNGSFLFVLKLNTKLKLWIAIYSREDYIILPKTIQENYNIFYNKKHQTVDIIKLNGSVELGPIVGLSDVIVDIVETGSTLKENGLEVLEEICPLSARMIVNQVSMKMEADRIKKLIADIKEIL